MLSPPFTYGSSVFSFFICAFAFRPIRALLFIILARVILSFPNFIRISSIAASSFLSSPAPLSGSFSRSQDSEKNSLHCSAASWLPDSDRSSDLFSRFVLIASAFAIGRKTKTSISILLNNLNSSFYEYRYLGSHIFSSS